MDDEDFYETTSEEENIAPGDEQLSFKPHKLQLYLKKADAKGPFGLSCTIDSTSRDSGVCCAYRL